MSLRVNLGQILMLMSLVSTEALERVFPHGLGAGQDASPPHNHNREREGYVGSTV